MRCSPERIGKWERDAGTSVNRLALLSFCEALELPDAQRRELFRLAELRDLPDEVKHYRAKVDGDGQRPDSDQENVRPITVHDVGDVPQPKRPRRSLSIDWQAVTDAVECGQAVSFALPFEDVERVRSYVYQYLTDVKTSYDRGRGCFFIRPGGQCDALWIPAAPHEKQPARFRGSAIGELMDREGISFPAFARRIGVRTDLAYAWSRGRVSPFFSRVMRMCAEFGVAPAFFAEGLPEPEPVGNTTEKGR